MCLCPCPGVVACIEVAFLWHLGSSVDGKLSLSVQIAVQSIGCVHDASNDDLYAVFRCLQCVCV